MKTAIMTETKAEILPISEIVDRTYRHPVTKIANTLRYFIDRNGEHVVCLIRHNHPAGRTSRFVDVATARSHWATLARTLTESGFVRCEDGRN